LGVHRRTVTVSGGGYTLTVLYAGVARPGLDVPLRVSVTSDHGFGKQITLGVDRRYLGIFESQGMFPDNSDATSLGADTVLLSYRPRRQATCSWWTSTPTSNPAARSVPTGRSRS
jgi:hypothetical protein